MACVNTAPTSTADLSLLRRLTAKLALFLAPTSRFRLLGLPSAVVTDDLAHEIPGYVTASRGAATLHHIPHGIAWNRGAHLDSRYRLLEPLSYGMNRPMLDWMHKRQRFFPRIQTLPETTVSLVGDGHDNFYHWLYDTLPKFAALNPERLAQAHYLACLKHPFHRQTFELLGIPLSSITPSTGLNFYQANKLLIPTAPFGPTSETIHFLQELLVHPVEAQLPTEFDGARIYISRRSATSRRLVNEEAFLQRLQPLGFRAIETERLTLLQQIALFRRAEIILSVHGAALANLAFCRPGARFIVFTPAGNTDPLYRNLTKAAQVNALFQEVPVAPGSDPDPIKADFILDTADLDLLQSNLQSLGVN